MSRFTLILIVSILVLSLLGACGLAAAGLAAITPIAKATAPAPVTEPVVVEVPAATPTLPAPTEVSQSGPTFNYDSSLASGFNLQIIPAVSERNDYPIWEVAPQHTQIDLLGYPIANHLHKPRIYIYPVDEFKSTSEAGKRIISDLQTLLKDQTTDMQYLPFLPFFNAQQVFHSQVKFLSFKDGQGVRFLTQFDQAYLPINNYELFYTFQGLTSDGKLYVAAILPVTLPGLPADSTVPDEMKSGDFVGKFLKYLDEVTQQLNGQSASSFTPSLDALDAMMASLKAK